MSRPHDKKDLKKVEKSLKKTDKKKPPKVTLIDIRNDDQLAKFLKDFPPKHRQFCENYLETLKQAKSYMKVFDVAENVAAAAASRLLRNVKVCAYLEYRWKQRQLTFRVSENTILQNMLDVFDKSMQAKAVLDHEGNETGVFTFHPTAAVQSNALIAKLMNFGEKKKDGKDDNVILVRTYVVPAFNNSVVIPESTREDVKKAVEKHLIDKKRGKVND